MDRASPFVLDDKTMYYAIVHASSKPRKQVNARSWSEQSGRHIHAAGADRHYQPLCTACSKVILVDSELSPDCTPIVSIMTSCVVQTVRVALPRP
jgi:hypothetical protein